MQRRSRLQSCRSWRAFPAGASERRIQGRHFFLLGYRVGRLRGERDEQFRSQAVDDLFPVGRRGEKLLLQTAEIDVEFLGIRRIENPVFRKPEPLRGIFSGRKVKITVAEAADRLIVLGGSPAYKGCRRSRG